jgi:hypothetical protein
LSVVPKIVGMLDNLDQSSDLLGADFNEPNEPYESPVVSNLWEVLENPLDPKNRSKKFSPRYRFMWRWTEHSQNDVSLFEDPDRILMLMIDLLNLKRLVFQLEKGPQTGKRHYQGFFIIGAVKDKKRPKEVISILRSKFFGIKVRPSVADSSIAEAYVTKRESPILGPYSFP